MTLLRSFTAIAVACTMVAGCSKPNKDGATGSTDASNVSIKIDGSSTVFPINEMVAELYGAENKGAKITVGESGTGGGFKKFLNGEIDIVGASRPIKDTEIASAKEKGIEYLELPVAFDGLTVVVNASNTFVDKLTINELNALWKPGSTVSKWSEVRQGWPAEAIKLYSPGTASGTFDYFTEVVNGKGGESRTDFSASEDDNVIVTGVMGDKNALGYFGYSYFVENQDKLKAVPIVNEAGEAVSPSEETIRSNKYNPMSRPLFIYVNAKSLENEAVKNFVKFYISHSAKSASEVGYVSLSDEVLQKVTARIDAKQVGTAYHTADKMVEKLF